MSAHGDYGSFDVKQMFHMVDAAKRDLPQTHEQIKAWGKTSEMLEAHGDKLRGYRNDLVVQWPPEQNGASAAYLRHLDELLSAVGKTATASAVNYWQLVHTAEAIEQAHKTLKPLYDEYVSNVGKLADYQAQIDKAEAVGTDVGRAAGPIMGGALGLFGGGAVGGYVAKTGAEVFTSSPVADGRQDELNRQARTAMTSLGGAAHDATSNMETPLPYEPPTIVDGASDSGTDIGSDSTGGGAQRPPAIAPPAHTRSSYASGLPAADGAEVPGLPVSPSTGPVLSGGAVGTLPAVGVLPAVGGPTPSPVGGLPAGMVFGVPPVSGAFGSGPKPAAAGGVGKPGGNPVAGRTVRALPPGGVIGGEGGLGATGGRGAAGARRANPVGGVLGQGGPAGPAAAGGRGAAGHGGGGPGVLGGQRAGRSSDEREERTWDPDNPWAVDDGVAPVIQPGREPKSHDPGPGVIGIDR